MSGLKQKEEEKNIKKLSDKKLRFRKFRLRKKKDFERVFSGRSMPIPELGITVRYTENGLGYPRFAVVVPKKSVKLAVRRNRIKRIVKEAVRHLIKEGKIPGYDIVIVVRKDISKMKSYDVEGAFSNLICDMLIKKSFCKQRVKQKNKNGNRTH